MEVSIRPSKPKSLKLQIAECAQGYLSAPIALYTEENVKRVRHQFPDLAVKTFERFFKSRHQWTRRLHQRMATIDCLIILVPSDRRICGGVARDLRAALILRKLVIVFDVTEGRYWRYRGADRAENKSLILRPNSPQKRKTA